MDHLWSPWRLEYVKGTAWALTEAGKEVRGWEGVLAGDVPIGAGNTIEPGGPDHPEILERAVSFLPRDEVRGPDDVPRVLPRGVTLPDRDNAVGIAIRQRIEQDAADDAQDG